MNLHSRSDASVCFFSNASLIAQIAYVGLLLVVTSASNLARNDWKLTHTVGGSSAYGPVRSPLKSRPKAFGCASYASPLRKSVKTEQHTYLQGCRVMPRPKPGNCGKVPRSSGSILAINGTSSVVHESQTCDDVFERNFGDRERY